MQNKTITPSNKKIRARLPDRITGIVFWGLVLMGIGFSLFEIKQFEKSFVADNKLTLLHTSQLISNILLTNPSAKLDSEQLKTFLKHELIRSHIDLISVESKSNKIHAGVEPDEKKYLISHLQIIIPSNNKKINQFTITIGQEKAQTFANHRKNLLLVMGMTLIFFGIILNWILRKILSDPFNSMIDKAHAFIEGNHAIRFNDTRDDEFGFLSGFINKALDNLLVKQTELENSLAREIGIDRELQKQKEQAEVTLQALNEAVITVDNKHRIVYLNPAAEQLTGWLSSEAIHLSASTVIKLVDEENQHPISCPLLQCMKQNTLIKSHLETLLINKRGQKIHIEFSASPMKNQQNNITGAVIIVQNVADTRKLTKELSYRASHDDLTSLVNRSEFEHRLKNLLIACQVDHSQHALCYIDLDQFKIVNDTAGHQAGDALLAELSKMMHDFIRESDVLGRLGGDEFGLLLANCQLDKARQICQKLLDAIKQFSFVWGKHRFEIGASIGLVAITPEVENIKELMSSVDMACYASKQAGRNRITTHSLGNDEILQLKTEMQLVNELRKNIKNDRFLLYAQSIIPTQHNDNNHIHVEILLRMINDKNEHILPDVFLPAAERYDLSIEIDKWVIKALFIDHANELKQLYQQHQHHHFIISCNLSGQSITDKHFKQFLADILQKSSLPLNAICFEITETVAISNIRIAQQFITEFSNKGCKFALDDFGSGMTSFAYLKYLPVDYLKIDGSYVKDLVSDKIDKALVKSVNEIGHALGMQSIAEFVESQAILNELKTLNVDYAQGYHIHRPQPLSAWVKQISQV